MRNQKLAREFKKKSFKICDIWVLWQQIKDLNMSLLANSQVELKQSTESTSIDFVFLILSDSKILYGSLSSLFKQQIHRNQ